MRNYTRCISTPTNAPKIMCTRHINHRGLHFDIDTDLYWGEPEQGHDLVRCESDQGQSHCFKLATHRVNLKNRTVVRMCEDCILLPLPVGSYTIERITGPRWVASSKDLRDGSTMARKVSSWLNKIPGMRSKVTTKLERTEEDGWTFKVSVHQDDRSLVSIQLIQMSNHWSGNDVVVIRSFGAVTTIKVVRVGDHRQREYVSESRWDQTDLEARKAEFHAELMTMKAEGSAPKPAMVTRPTDAERLAKMAKIEEIVAAPGPGSSRARYFMIESILNS